VFSPLRSCHTPPATRPRLHDVLGAAYACPVTTAGCTQVTCSEQDRMRSAGGLTRYGIIMRVSQGKTEAACSAPSGGGLYAAVSCLECVTASLDCLPAVSALQILPHKIFLNESNNFIFSLMRAYCLLGNSAKASCSMHCPHQMMTARIAANARR